MPHDPGRTFEVSDKSSIGTDLIGNIGIQQKSSTLHRL